MVLRKSLNSYFDKNPEKDWVIVSGDLESIVFGELGGIIDSGAKHNEPLNKEITALSKKKGQLCFLFSREAIVE